MPRAGPQALGGISMGDLLPAPPSPSLFSFPRSSGAPHLQSYLTMDVIPRRHKSSEERRAQRQRAQGRVIGSILRSVHELQRHRGARPTRLAQALSDVLADVNVPPAAVPTVVTVVLDPDVCPDYQEPCPDTTWYHCS